VFSHLQFGQIWGRQPYSIVRKIPYLISGFHCDRAGTVPLAMLAVFLEAKIALTLVQPEALANKVIRSNK
jgi:hypothetical protein